ncbi:MAG TPA: DNA polymerase subunit beta [Firmicutes bacterium]|jgi:predicted nucleotidyltransferase|nr:DNA polymerase subunit beta [Bacillota bacterium]HBK69175.1 DNA polymerase subunit beta [Bacillota bacterium]HBT16418.1 DNA polymerase subunit beta [Bacillota bacterium]
MKDYQPYIQAWQERFKQDVILAVKRKRDAQIVAERMVSILLRKYKVKEVYLFGSVIIPDKEFSIGSDIDLGVSGLSTEDFYQAWNEIETLSEFEVDLIDLDHCSPEFRIKVLSEGRRYQTDEKPILSLDERN